MKFIVPITKVDEAKRLVIGRAAQEFPDKADEVMDYETSKPEFEEWSNHIEQLSGGKSKGNIRSMHGKIAAGIIKDMTFADDDKAVDIVAHIVDENEWNKVVKGVYTGFSIGGSYKERWKDGEYTRYTAKPTEISLVDNPCIPTARFYDLVKANGAVERHAFVNQVDPNMGDSGTPDSKVQEEEGKQDEAYDTENSKDGVVEKTVVQEEEARQDAAYDVENSEDGLVEKECTPKDEEELDKSVYEDSRNKESQSFESAPMGEDGKPKRKVKEELSTQVDVWDFDTAMKMAKPMTFEQVMAKDGRAGRDADGDGVFNEGKENEGSGESRASSPKKVNVDNLIGMYSNSKTLKTEDDKNLAVFMDAANALDSGKASYEEAVSTFEEIEEKTGFAINADSVARSMGLKPAGEKKQRGKKGQPGLRSVAAGVGGGIIGSNVGGLLGAGIGSAGGRTGQAVGALAGTLAGAMGGGYAGWQWGRPARKATLFNDLMKDGRAGRDADGDGKLDEKGKGAEQGKSKYKSTDEIDELAEEFQQQFNDGLITNDELQSKFAELAAARQPLAESEAEATGKAGKAGLVGMSTLIGATAGSGKGRKGAAIGALAGGAVGTAAAHGLIPVAQYFHNKGYSEGSSNALAATKERNMQRDKALRHARVATEAGAKLGGGAAGLYTGAGTGRTIGSALGSGFGRGGSAVGAALGTVAGGAGGAFLGYQTADAIIDWAKGVARGGGPANKAVLFNDLVKVDITDRHMRPYVGSQQAIDAAEAKDEIILEQATLKKPKVKNHPNLGKAVEGDRVSGDFGLGTVTAIREDGVVTPMDADYSVQAEPGDPVLIVETEDGVVEADNASKVQIVKYADVIECDPGGFFMKMGDDLSLTKAGNPYRDKEGKFTDKSNAAFTVGTATAVGATAGAAAGAAAGREAARKPKPRRAAKPKSAPKARKVPGADQVDAKTAFNWSRRTKKAMNSVQSALDSIKNAEGSKAVAAGVAAMRRNIGEAVSQQLKDLGQALSDPKLASRVFTAKNLKRAGQFGGFAVAAYPVVRGVLTGRLDLEIDPTLDNGRVGAKLVVRDKEGDTQFEIGGYDYFDVDPQTETKIRTKGGLETIGRKANDFREDARPGGFGGAPSRRVSGARPNRQTSSLDWRDDFQPAPDVATTFNEMKGRLQESWDKRKDEGEAGKEAREDLILIQGSALGLADQKALDDESASRIIFNARYGPSQKPPHRDKAFDFYQNAIQQSRKRYTEEMGEDQYDADLALVSLGPNLSPIHRARLIDQVDSNWKVRERTTGPSEPRKAPATPKAPRPSAQARRFIDEGGGDFVEIDEMPDDVASELREMGVYDEADDFEFSAPVDFTKAMQEMAEERNLFKLAKSTPPKRGESREEYITRLVSRIG